jgi:hypothetical protein
LSKQKTLAP